MRKSRSKRLKLLTELKIAYSGAKLMNEEFVWEAYRDRVQEAAIQLARFSESNPKYDKKISILMMELHQEVLDHSS